MEWLPTTFWGFVAFLTAAHAINFVVSLGVTLYALFVARPNNSRSGMESAMVLGTLSRWCHVLIIICIPGAAFAVLGFANGLGFFFVAASIASGFWRLRQLIPIELFVAESDNLAERQQKLTELQKDMEALVRFRDEIDRQSAPSTDLDTNGPWLDEANRTVADPGGMFRFSTAKTRRRDELNRAVAEKQRKKALRLRQLLGHRQNAGDEDAEREGIVTEKGQKEQPKPARPNRPTTQSELEAEIRRNREQRLKNEETARLRKAEAETIAANRRKQEQAEREVHLRKASESADSQSKPIQAEGPPLTGQQRYEQFLRDRERDIESVKDELARREKEHERKIQPEEQRKRGGNCDRNFVGESVPRGYGLAKKTGSKPLNRQALQVRAGEMACGLLEGVDCFANSLAQDLQGTIVSHATVPPALYAEALYLTLHLVDRLTFQLIGPELRPEFFDPFASRLTEILADAGADVTGIRAEFNTLHNEYARYSAHIGQSTKPTKGSLYWEFGRHVAARFGVANPATCVALALNATNYAAVLCKILCDPELGILEPG